MWECTQVILFSISFQLSGLSTLISDTGMMLRAQSVAGTRLMLWTKSRQTGNWLRGRGVGEGDSPDRRPAAGLQGPEQGMGILTRAASILKRQMMCWLLFTSKHIC